MELAVWVETEFGYSVENLEAIETVTDCVLLVAGRLSKGAANSVMKMDKRWSAGSSEELKFADGEFICSSSHLHKNR